MAHEDDIQLRLSAQRALLTHITPSMRAVSVEVVPDQRLAWVRFIFDGEPAPAEEETASVAHTEILTDFVDEWTVELEIVQTPAPLRMNHRRFLVYERCEDEWVIGRAESVVRRLRLWRSCDRGLGRFSAMRVYVESVLPCSAEKVWDEVQHSALLLEVVRPLVRIVPADGPQFPERWLEGTTVRCRSYLFGVIPLGTHTIFLERIDPAAREIQSREKDPLIHRWDHLVRVRPAGDGRTHYSDEIIIEAGWATFVVWLFAQWFYRHRQRRWRQVAHRLMAAEQVPTADRPRE